MSCAPVVVACDLDRTLIYSAAALRLQGDDRDAPDLLVAEVYGGVPISFTTRASEGLLVSLAAAAHLVPVTTRTVAQYQRVRLPGVRPTHAVTTNGGALLVDGVPDLDWRRRLDARVAEECAPLAQVEALLTDAHWSTWTLSVKVAEDLFVYAVVDRAEMPETAVADLAARCDELGWTVSVQGRKVYCVPSPVTKAAALEEVRARTGADLVLAAGDSLLDQGMLEVADHAFRPAHGELHDLGWTASHLTVTDADGVLAGEELLRRMSAVVADAARAPAPVSA